MTLPASTQSDSRLPAMMISTETSANGLKAWIQPQTTPLPITPNTDIASAVRMGLLLLGLGFGGFMAWASLAPLDEGIPAAGVISVEGSRKRIDHPNGGIIESIKVREGQTVAAHEELLVLNATQSRSALNAGLNQWYAATAMLARLRAERDNASRISFPRELTDAAKKDPEAKAAISAQEDLLRTRRVALEGELRIIRESARGLEQQLQSLEQLKRGREQQIALYQEQLASFRQLKAEGFVSRNNILSIEQQLVEVQGRQSEDLANMAGINARLSEFRMRASQREMEYRREIETLMTETQREVANLGERITSLEDNFQRLVVRSPVAGTVVDLGFHTVGGVIKPGDRILDIVPSDDQLVVEARVPPQNVDRLRPGLTASVHFDAYADRLQIPVISGLVEVVSADILTDSRTGEPYYSIRVSVPAPEMAKLGSLQLQPGMPSTVMIKTGERTLMTYLLQPILRRFVTSLTE